MVFGVVRGAGAGNRIGQVVDITGYSCSAVKGRMVAGCVSTVPLTCNTMGDMDTPCPLGWWSVHQPWLAPAGLEVTGQAGPGRLSPGRQSGALVFRVHSPRRWGDYNCSSCNSCHCTFIHSIGEEAVASAGIGGEGGGMAVAGPSSSLGPVVVFKQGRQARDGMPGTSGGRRRGGADVMPEIVVAGQHSPYVYISPGCRSHTGTAPDRGCS